MKKASFKKTFHVFHSEADMYGALMQDIVGFSFQGQQSTKRKQKLMEAIAIRIHVAWEVFIENLLIDCLNQDTSQYASYQGMNLRKHLSRDTCELLLTGIRFLDIRGVGNLKATAKNIIVEKYNSFGAIDKEDASLIDEFYVIRNYLAHQSRMSRRRLQTEVYEKGHQISRFIDLGRFLSASSNRRKSDQGQSTRLQIYLGAFVNAADAMEAYYASNNMFR